MVKDKRFWLLIMALIFCSGCQSTGNNSSYLLKYKKDLRQFYEEIIEKARADKNVAMIAESTASTMENKAAAAKDKVKAEKSMISRANEATTYLSSIYLTNIPLSLSDHYDTRNPKKSADAKAINQGDPLNIIINKVHLANNAELLCGATVCLDTAEIAVVVTVDDGRQEEPKNVVVAYEEGLKQNVDLPIANLLAYANGSYDNQPIRVTVTVFEFDQLENENFKKMLGTAAGIGATLTPAYAPAWSMATQVGNFLINQNKDDIVVKFTFQVYPRSLPPTDSVVGDLGMPPIQGGSYIILNTNTAKNAAEVNRQIHLDFGLNAFTIEVPKPPTVSKIVNEDFSLHPWPIPNEAVPTSDPLNESYVVLTVGKSPTRSAAMIIDRLDAFNRKATGLTNVEARSQAGAALLGRDLDDIRSAVTWYFAEGEYADRKADPRALGEIFRVAEDPRLNEPDKHKAVILLDRSLPPMSNAFKTANGITTKTQEAELANKKKWYDVVKARATYDPSESRLMCKGADGKEQDCQ